MDETGYAHFAAMGNLAKRAGVTLDECEAAVRVLEAPDKESSDPSNDGKRIERIPGGWMVLNAEKYRLLVNRAVIQEQTRMRVQRFRQKKRGNAPVTVDNEKVTPSEALAGSEAGASSDKPRRSVFIEPTPSVVEAYSSEIGYPLNGQAWCDSYAQKGWIVGKTKMRDWKAAVRNWKANGWKPDGAQQTIGRTRAATPEEHRANPWGDPA